MTILSIPALVMAVIALYVASYHLLIFFRRPESRVDLTFALTALCIGGYDIFCASLYNVNSPAEGVLVQRWQLISLAFLSISFAWFIFDYTSMKSKIGPWMFTVIFSVFALFGLFDRSGLAWTDTPLIKNFQLPYFGWNITYYEMEFGLAMLLEAFMLMVFYFYLYMVAIHYYWKKNPKRAMPLVIGTGIFMLGMSEDVFVALGYYNFIYTIEYSFMGMVLVMAYTLSSEIVERGRIKEELLESQRKLALQYAEFQAIFNSITDAIVFVDRDRRIIMTNPAFQSILGYDLEEVVGKTTQLIYAKPEEFFQQGQKRFTKGAKVDSPVYEIDYQRKDGSVFTSETLGVPVKSINGETIGFLGVIRDITERMQVEADLKMSEKKYRRLVESLENEYIIYSHDLDGNFTYLSPSIIHVLGYSQDEFMGHYAEYMTDSPINNNVEEHTNAALRGEKQEPYEAEFWHKNGGRVHLRVTEVPVFDEHGTVQGVEGIVQDITDKKYSENKLREYAERQTILLREVNHRVKNNLVSIISLLHKEEDRAEEEGFADYLPRFRETIGRIERLLVVHSLLSKGGWNPLSLQQLCEMIILHVFKGIVDGQDFSYEVSPSDIAVNSDQAHYLTMIINELTTNAIKYSKQDKPARIWVTIDSKGDFVHLTFRDDGPGYQERILQGDIPNKSVGLQLIFGIVSKSLQGEIELKNDEGAVSRIIFPKAVAAGKDHF